MVKWKPLKKELRMSDPMAKLLAGKLRERPADTLLFCLPGLLGGHWYDFEDGSMIAVANWGRDGWSGGVDWVDGDFADTQAGKVVESTGVPMPLRDGEYTALLASLEREVQERERRAGERMCPTRGWDLVREVVPLEVRKSLRAWPGRDFGFGGVTLMFIPDWYPDEALTS